MEAAGKEWYKEWVDCCLTAAWSGVGKLMVARSLACLPDVLLLACYSLSRVRRAPIETLRCAQRLLVLSLLTVTSLQRHRQPDTNRRVIAIVAARRRQQSFSQQMALRDVVLVADLLLDQPLSVCHPTRTQLTILPTVGSTTNSSSSTTMTSTNAGHRTSYHVWGETCLHGRRAASRWTTAAASDGCVQP